MPKSLFSKKLIPVYLLLPVLIVITVLLFSLESDTRTFNTLTETIFKEELSGNTLNLHYTLAHPEDFGIAHYAPVLPCYSAAGQTQSQQELASYIEALTEIDREKLEENQQYTYTLLSRFLQQTMEGNTFPYYDEPLSPSGGMQSQLPILLAEYTFRDTQDVEDYLALLDQTDEYFAALLVYEQEKKDAGLLQADTSLEQVREQCYTILSKEELAQGTHFLQTTFSERLDKLLAQGLITEEDAATYISSNNRLLTTVMQPAYETLGDGLFLLMGDGASTPAGLCHLPQGQAYYEWLVKENTGSALSVEEIKALLYPQFNEEYTALHDMLAASEDSVSMWIKALQGNSFSLSSPEEMLADLQTRMSADFPALPATSGSTAHAGSADMEAQGALPDSSLFTASLPSLAVKEVSPSLEDYCAPAFYLTPPLDDTENNVIYINEKSTPEGLELYTTLAHEGYPGHLYQSVYSQRTMMSKEEDPVRQLFWYGGYLEGWALYVEFISYDYATELAMETGDIDAAYAYQIEKHNRNMQLCLYALLDVAIHYDGASYEQVHEVLGAFGILDADTTRRVYDYIAEEPANYLKYYLGYLEILRLKEAAKEQWGNEYSDLRFHTFYLDCGPSDFTSLTEALTKY
ncbi:MAG: DUF885 domain-containing protein [Lachnospiraceae bacterium]|nr:DUF885 domain-containing protein [Lachnospiraceae bacterium]